MESSIAVWVLSVFKSRDRVTILTLYKSIVRSHLEYCCPLWHPTSKIADIQELESVQRISGLSSLNYWERLKSLKLTSLQRQGICSSDLQIKFTDPLRLGIKSIVPAISRAARKRNQTLYEHSFAVLGPRLWNTLPKDLTMISCQQKFLFDRFVLYIIYLLSIKNFKPLVSLRPLVPLLAGVALTP